jgi:transcriptional regulator with XRE-family HTH domain
MDLGKAIKYLRQTNGYSQGMFATALDVGQSHLSQIENGHKKPSVDLLEKISEIVHVPLAVLFWFSVERKDIIEGKQHLYDNLKPSIDALMTEVFGKNILKLG